MATVGLHLASFEGATMASSHTLGDSPHCQCSRIMGFLENSTMPFLSGNGNFTTKQGPGLPVQFVQQHGREVAMEVTLQTAGLVSTVMLEIGEPGNAASVSMGLHWERVMERAQFHAEDLLFFVLQGQSRFAVTHIHGHNRRMAEDAQPESFPHLEKRKLKPSERLLSDVLEQGRRNSPAKRAPGQTSRTRAVRRRFPPTLGSGEGGSSHHSIPVQNFMGDGKPAIADEPGNEDTEMEEASAEYSLRIAAATIRL